LYPLGIITLDEAREMVDLDPAENGEGDQFYQKPTPTVVAPADPSNPANQDPKNPEPDEGGNE
jgi:hypothetical protein